MRRAVLLALSFAALAALPATADAACPSGAQCGRVTVPLDHSGATAGTLSVAYAKLAATGTRTGTLVLLSGGPGQPALPLTAEFAELVEPLRASHDIVTVDQRGVGDSGAVECSASDAPGCATKLGAQRPFLNTPETARDLEDVRVALGVERLTLFGVSYGAKVAGEYARRYPAQTAAVVLDSPVPVDGLDAVNELRSLGTPRVLREACFPGLCHRTVTDPDEALAAAAERLQDGSLAGPLVRSSGRVTTARVSEQMLYGMLARSDENPQLRAGLPAAIASLAAGDAAPALHLAELLSAAFFELDGFSYARFFATTCIEGRMPWAPESPVASRDAAARAFVADRASIFAPFSPETVLNASAADACAEWPPTPRPEAVAYRGPDVPVLVLAGRDDLRTPLEDARRTALQYPNARVLAVPGVGHSVLSSDFSGCARAGLVAFLGGRPVAACTRGRAELVAAPYAPATIGALRPTRLPGLPGRTLSAITVTLTGIAFDAATQADQTFRLPGLRSGYVRATKTALELHGVEWIRGVRVSGRLDSRGRGTLTVSGSAAAPGSVTYTRDRASGTLGGRSFTLSR